jgi:hypothetical protein
MYVFIVAYMDSYMKEFFHTVLYDFQSTPEYMISFQPVSNHTYSYDFSENCIETYTEE